MCFSPSLPLTTHAQVRLGPWAMADGETPNLGVGTPMDCDFFANGNYSFLFDQVSPIGVLDQVRRMSVFDQEKGWKDAIQGGRKGQFGRWKNITRPHPSCSSVTPLHTSPHPSDPHLLRCARASATGGPGRRYEGAACRTAASSSPATPFLRSCLVVTPPSASSAMWWTTPTAAPLAGRWSAPLVRLLPLRLVGQMARRVGMCRP